MTTLAFFTRVARMRMVVACVLVSACASSAVRRPDLSLFKLPPSDDIGVVVNTADTLADVIRMNVSYKSPIEGRVPAQLFLPRTTTGAGNSAAIIFLHGMPGTPHKMAPLAEAYARAGVIGLAISAPFNRTDLSHRTPERARLLPAPLFNSYDRSELIQLVAEVSRAVDLLVADARVDAKRIGMVGFSYGGSIGALMSVVEPRLAAVALMSPSSGLATVVRSWPKEHFVKLEFRGLPRAEQNAWLAGMDSVEAGTFLKAYRSSVPILIQAGRSDFVVARSDINALIKAAGTKNTTVRWYEAGHILPPVAQLDQASFFANTLGIRTAGFVAAPAFLR